MQQRAIHRRLSRRVEMNAGLVAIFAIVASAACPAIAEPLALVAGTSGNTSRDVASSQRWRTVVIPARDAQASLKSQPQPATRPLTGYAHELQGVASYYWQDQETASGERFNRRAMTAAHKTLPIGTRVKITNLSNGKSAIVRINDRGPFRGGRVIDVSEAAAEHLSMTGSGLARVSLEVVQ